MLRALVDGIAFLICSFLCVDTDRDLDFDLGLECNLDLDRSLAIEAASSDVSLLVAAVRLINFASYLLVQRGIVV